MVLIDSQSLQPRRGLPDRDGISAVLAVGPAKPGTIALKLGLIS